MWRSWWFISLIILFCGCNKYIKDDYPEEKLCERFAGKYKMYDPLSGENYWMEVSCIYVDHFVSNADSIQFVNFANKFSFTYLAYFSSTNSYLDGTSIDPLTDKNGYRWNFSNSSNYSYENRHNLLIQDSIYIRLWMNNAQYYIDDSTNYQDIENIQSGIKVH
ncbi:MAG: hypothetical protein WDZ35_10485 [Crocinitomicaceae bacterium]